MNEQAQPLLEGNRCEANKESGIAFRGNAGGTARKNVCRNNDSYGIFLDYDVKPVLEDNFSDKTKQESALFGCLVLIFLLAVIAALVWYFFFF